MKWQSPISLTNPGSQDDSNKGGVPIIRQSAAGMKVATRRQTTSVGSIKGFVYKEINTNSPAERYSITSRFSSEVSTECSIQRFDRDTRLQRAEVETHKNTGGGREEHGRSDNLKSYTASSGCILIFYCKQIGLGFALKKGYILLKFRVPAIFISEGC